MCIKFSAIHKELSYNELSYNELGENMPKEGLKLGTFCFK